MNTLSIEPWVTPDKKSHLTKHMSFDTADAVYHSVLLVAVDTWVDRRNVKVQCPTQKHNTAIPASVICVLALDVHLKVEHK